MNKKVLEFVNRLEGYKTAIKELHWNSDNMSQHKLCDDIADRIDKFQDKVSEVEQSINGKINKNQLKPIEYKVVNLKKFVEDVLDKTNTFLKSIKNNGDSYIGMRSDCESFLSDMQSNLYLVDFTMKEDLKRRLQNRLNESRPKNIANVDNVEKFMGRRPVSIKARINQIYRIVKKYGLDSKRYNDDHWQAIEDYYKVITSLGCEVIMKPCAHLINFDSMESDGGYTDHDASDNMPRSKQYGIRITFDDGMNIDGYIKCMACGTVQDPFSMYDTCMVLWPKNNHMLEQNNSKYLNKTFKLNENDLHQIIKEAAMNIIETELGYDVDNFSGKWNKSEPSDEEFALASSYAEGDSLDDPFNEPNSFEDDEWIDGDKDMENDYSWNLHNRMNNVGKSPIDHQHDIMHAAQNRRDHAAYWTDKDNEHGNRLMSKWVNGERNLDDLEDADFSYDPYKYNESKQTMKSINKISESQLKDIVRGTAMKIIKEYTNFKKN